MDKALRDILETFDNQYPERDYTHPYCLSGVYLGLSQDGPARLRHADDRLHSGGKVRGIEKSENVFAAVSQHGHFLRNRDQPDSRRSGGGAKTAQNDANRRFQRPGWNYHYGDGEHLKKDEG